MTSRIRMMALAAGAMLSTLALTPTLVGADHAPGQGAGSRQDLVTGAGHHSVPDTQFTIAAHHGPQGARGTFSFKTAGQDRIQAEVTCLTVTGNQAIATGIYIDQQTGTSQTVVMHAVDNGEPGSVTPDLLRFSFAGFIRPDPANPGCFLPVLPPVPVTEGNIVVHDGQS